MAQAAVKEKVIRVVVATFRNLVTKAPSANLPAMLVAQLLPFAKNLATRKWSDEDVLEDVQFLRDELKARFESLTCDSLIFLLLHSNNHLEPTTNTNPSFKVATCLGLLSMNPICSGKRMQQS